MTHTSPATAVSHPVARVFLLLDRLLGYVESAMMGVACALVAAIMLLVSSDAIGRYLFHTPIAFTYDLVTGYLLPASLFLALSFTLRRGGHVNLDFFIHLMSARTRNFVIGALLLISAPIVVLMATGGAAKTWHSWQTASVTIGVYAWPIWAKEIIIPISMGVLALRMTHIAVVNLAAAFADDDSVAIAISPPRNQPAEDAV